MPSAKASIAGSRDWTIRAPEPSNATAIGWPTVTGTPGEVAGQQSAAAAQTTDEAAGSDRAAAADGAAGAEDAACRRRQRPRRPPRLLHQRRLRRRGAAADLDRPRFQGQYPPAATFRPPQHRHGCRSRRPRPTAMGRYEHPPLWGRGRACRPSNSRPSGSVASSRSVRNTRVSAGVACRGDRVGVGGVAGRDDGDLRAVWAERHVDGKDQRRQRGPGAGGAVPIDPGDAAVDDRVAGVPAAVTAGRREYGVDHAALVQDQHASSRRGEGAPGNAGAHSTSEQFMRSREPESDDFRVTPSGHTSMWTAKWGWRSSQRGPRSDVAARCAPAVSTIPVAGMGRSVRAAPRPSGGAKSTRPASRPGARRCAGCRPAGTR